MTTTRTDPSHWNDETNENAPADALRMTLGTDAAHEPFEEETIMSKKKATDATTKPAKKREPKEKVALRTLALRVTNAEFDLVHKAAGPRNLSAFMKSAVLGQASKALSK